MSDYGKLTEAILNGDSRAAVAVTQEALAAQADPQDLVTNYMIPAMDEIGKRFETGDCFVPELLISARAMKASLELIRPLLAARGAQPVGRVIIGTVKGDLHDIGKNLVASMLEGAGFEVIARTKAAATPLKSESSPRSPAARPHSARRTRMATPSRWKS